MSMFTRCPHCDTMFRVTPQQLQVSSGQVRCGRCQRVFDAFSTLTARLPGGQPREDAPSEPPAEPDRREALSHAQTWSAESAAAEEVPPASRASATAPAAPAPAAPPEAEALTLPVELFGAAGQHGSRWRWRLAGLVALLALALQAAWFFPTGIALRLPSLRPLLVQYCAWTGCQAELPRMPDLLFIEASDLQLLDPAHPNEVLLTATVRNRAAVEQALPLLELTLTDPANRTAARKVFKPAEYLEAGPGQGEGIGAGREVSIRLYLDTGDLKAAGYRLYLFFA